MSSSRHWMKHGACKPSVCSDTLHIHTSESKGRSSLIEMQNASSLDMDIRRKTCQRYVLWQWRRWIRELEGNDNQSPPLNPAPSTPATSSSEGNSWRSSKNKKPQRSVQCDKRYKWKTTIHYSVLWLSVIHLNMKRLFKKQSGKRLWMKKLKQLEEMTLGSSKPIEGHKAITIN